MTTSMNLANTANDGANDVPNSYATSVTARTLEM
ncbi:unnamed protein product [Penicillium camemberti]|uniref:Str. FM013 n=1 Tax=Penicillium camemberti (strain FM 013) TaxID=1429867 RepID=A0A0G4PXV1_PENC3|nr:unnamed protein product [Penicillium camemberti]